jgi:hypothetical protein
MREDEGLTPWQVPLDGSHFLPPRATEFSNCMAPRPECEGSEGGGGHRSGMLSGKSNTHALQACQRRRRSRKETTARRRR